MQKITTFLWFDDNAEQAINFYVSIFKDSKILEAHRYGEGAPMPAGTLFTARVRLAGQEYMFMNGGPHFRLNEAVSLFVNCDNQAEVDDLWERLSAGGEKSRCGWLKDRFGLSWQIVPAEMGSLLWDREHPEKAQRAMAAMMTMSKLDLAALKRAYEGK